MKVAICAGDGSIDAPVDSRFGRCACFVVTGTETGDNIEVITNDNAGAAGGAGPRSARLLADRGVNAVVAGNFGPKAVTVLRAAGIRLYTGAEGTVRDTVNKFFKGELPEFEEAAAEPGRA